MMRFGVIVFLLSFLVTGRSIHDQAVGRENADAPPVTRIGIGRGFQLGDLGTYCWGVSPFDYKCALAAWEFPDGLWVSGQDGRVLFKKVQPPRRVSVLLWTSLKPDGTPRGEPRRLPSTLDSSPTVASWGMGWHATFSFPDLPGHHYLSVRAVWIDEDFPLRDESAIWTFHLRSS